MKERKFVLLFGANQSFRVYSAERCPGEMKNLRGQVHSNAILGHEEDTRMETLLCASVKRVKHLHFCPVYPPSAPQAP